jgi:hypothetical protein
MDDQKNDEKKSLTERITDTVKGIVDTTSEAAMKTMKPSEPNPKHAEASEQASEPIDTVAAPEVVIKKRESKKSRPKTKKSVGTFKEQLAATKKTPKKKASKKASKTTAKKSRGKKMAKKSKKKSAVKKTAKKMMPKKKKSKR